MISVRNTILVTGGAGLLALTSCYIGSRMRYRRGQSRPAHYAGNPKNLAALEGDTRTSWCAVIFAMRASGLHCCASTGPAPSFHFAAESHVDRSIIDPGAFIRHQRTGDLHASRTGQDLLVGAGRGRSRSLPLLHVSTDEVYGSLGPEDPAFCESTAYAPNSPYAASKAPPIIWRGRNHRTYGLPCSLQTARIIIGPFQFPEKLITARMAEQCLLQTASRARTAVAMTGSCLPSEHSAIIQARISFSRELEGPVVYSSSL